MEGRSAWRERLDRVLSEVRGNPARAVLAAILVLAIVLRVSTIGAQSLDHDETVTAARILGHSFGRSMHVVFNGERSPPLYYATAWIWSQPFGTGAVALRLLSAGFGIATVLAAYLAGRELVSKRAGLFGALLVAVNPYLIWYSQEARSYGMFVMWSAFGLYMFARSLRRRDRSSVFGWAAMSVLALSTHYFAVFVIAPEAVLLVALLGPSRRVLGSIAVVGAVGLALVPLARSQEGTGRTNGFTQYALTARAETAIVKYATVEGPAPQGGITSTTTGQRQLGLAAAALVLLAAGIVAVRGSPLERRGAGIAMGVAAGAFAGPFLLALAGLDLVDPRNMIGALVPGLVAIGIGFSVARPRLLGASAAAASLGVFALSLHAVAVQPPLQRHDWQAAVAALPRPRDATLYVVPADGRAPLQYYVGSSLPHFEGKAFSDGIATNRVVVMSDTPSISGPGPRFTLRKSRTAPQHWTIRVYRAPHAVEIDPSQVAGTRVMAQPSAALAFRGGTLRRNEQLVDAREVVGPHAPRSRGA
ncbi:MAG: mannosyltransferase [Solirubrobacterales bacterium]|jgi:hypothetical protein|nr:mannosyltransferase [Solirubrobacterales bacterium]